MLACELRGEPFNKSEHNRRLQAALHRRSAGAIEFKHANISAVLIELGFPYIEGYKRRDNYQELLRDEVIARLDGDLELARLAEASVIAPISRAPEIASLAGVFVPVPVRDRTRSYERRVPPPVPRRGVNYLEREARNASLGLAGELFTLEVEHRRLWEGGRRTLAERIEHVSQTRGDGLGYDILSYDTDGRERLIEVKTTRFGVMTPFFTSRREVITSEESAPTYSLYRVFRFREAPRVFVLTGSLRDACILDPTEYRATLP